MARYDDSQQCFASGLELPSSRRNILPQRGFSQKTTFRRSTSVKRNEPVKLAGRPVSKLMAIASSWMIFTAVLSAVQDHRCYLLSYEGLPFRCSMVQSRPLLLCRRRISSAGDWQVNQYPAASGDKRASGATRAVGV